MRILSEVLHKDAYENHFRQLHNVTFVKPEPEANKCLTKFSAVNIKNYEITD